MSWKAYQNTLRNKQKESFKIFIPTLMVLLLIVGLVIYYFYKPNSGSSNAKTVNHPNNSGETKLNPSDEPIELSNIRSDETWRMLFRNYLDWTILEHGRNHVFLEDKLGKWQVDLTVNEALQTYIQRKLKQYDVDWGAVSMMDAETGAVLALTSYSNRKRTRGLSLKASFPAASIFKVISAAAALDQGKLNPNSEIRFSGDSRYITPSSIKKGGNGTRDLETAFAHSTNLVFGKIGAHILGKGLLERYAEAFAFNKEIGFDMNLEFSKAVIPDDDVGLGKVAAGLGEVSLNPIHASLIAACISNNGQMMSPYIVDKVTSPERKLKYAFSPYPHTRCMNKNKVGQIKKLMQSTVNFGTARSGFKGYRNDTYLKNLVMGGKTGSKTNLELKGWNEWFVGFAESPDIKISFGIVLVSEKYWKVKPHVLARDFIRFYYKNRATMLEKTPKIIKIGELNDE